MEKAGAVILWYCGACCVFSECENGWDNWLHDGWIDASQECSVKVYI